MRTPLYDLHVELGGKMVSFAGYALPVHYPSGIIKEHNHTREAAGLFDVSHMGQVRLSGDGGGRGAGARGARSTWSACRPIISATPSSPTRPAASSTT